MSDITLRLVKGSPLTNQEVDDNFANLNTDKYQAGDSASFQDVTLDNMTGPITWNTDEGALDIPLNAQVTLQAGQEFVFYAKATEAIANGDVVMFAGAQGGHLLIAKCDMGAAGFDPSHIVGIATQSFANNDFGYVTSKGKVRSLNTSGFTEGDILYVDPTTAGGFTSTKPAPPNHIVQVAAVTRSHANQGTVLTRVSHMPDTDEVPEGSTNLYFTDARAVSAIKADGDWNATNWDTAYGWGDHSTQNYATTTGDTMTGDLGFGDNVKAKFGASDDLQIYHDGSNSFITDEGTGSFYIRGSSQVRVETPTGENMAIFNDNGGVSLRYDNSKKFETTATGVNVTGTVTASGGNSTNWNTAYGWGNHSTQSYATQTYVNNAVSNLVDSAPATLDTLNELAAALGDDPNFAATVTNSIGAKVSKSGDTMTGNLNFTADNIGIAYTGHSGIYMEGKRALWSHNNGHVTLSGAGGDLYLGFNSGSDYVTGLITLQADTHNANKTIKIIDHDTGRVWSEGSRTFTDNYHPNADKWTTARSHTVTLTGQVTGSATQSVDGTGNKTWSIATTLNDSSLDDQYVTVGSRHSGDASNLFQTSRASVRLWDVSTATDDPTGANDGLVYTAGWDSSGWGVQQYHDFHSNDYFVRNKYNGTWQGWDKVWTDGNDGSGSGLDADLLDGLDSTRYTNLTPQIGSGDFNTIFNTGTAFTTQISQVANITSAVYTNKPTGVYGYGSVLNWRTENSTFQLYTSHTGDLVYRTGWNNDGYSGWRRVLNTGYYGDAWTSGNDGSGSGLDADLLDGVQGSNYLRSDVVDTLCTSKSSGTLMSRNGFSDFIGYNPSYGSYIGGGASNASNYLYSGGYISKNGVHTLWHSGNDGAGSGLDADLLDGQHGSYYAPASHNHSGVYLPISGKAADSELLDGVDITRIVHGNGVNRTDGGDPNTLRPSGFYENYQGNSPTSTWYNYINMRHTNAGNGHGHQIAGSFYSAGDIYNRSYSGNGTFTGWAKLWNTANDGSGSGLDADLLDGRDHTKFGATLATYGTTGGSSGRIRCTAPFTTNSGHMFQVTVSLYSSYACHTYVVSGYMYSTTNQWYSPKAVYTGTGTPDIFVGRDGNGKAYISIANGSYTGVRVHNMTRGYATSVADTYDPWIITVNNGSENSTGVTVSKVWHSTNDGSGSGLDADLLDGQHASAFLGVSAKAADSNLLDGIDSGSFLRSDASDSYSGTLTHSSQVALVPNDYGKGVFGLYSSTRYQHVWSMGTAYKTNTSGTSYGNMYGLTWTHTNVGTGTNQSISGLGHQLQLRMNGVLYCAFGSGIWTSGNITAYSDRAVKTNLEVIPNALAKVMQINGYTYDRTDYVEDPETGIMPDTRQAGVVAQEVEAILPEVVSGEEGNKAVAYGNMVALLIEAIKEQQIQIEELSSQFKSLKENN
jgi:hypothetical protein